MGANRTIETQIALELRNLKGNFGNDFAWSCRRIEIPAAPAAATLLFSTGDNYMRFVTIDLVVPPVANTGATIWVGGSTVRPLGTIWQEWGRPINPGTVWTPPDGFIANVTELYAVANTASTCIIWGLFAVQDLYTNWTDTIP